MIKNKATYNAIFFAIFTLIWALIIISNLFKTDTSFSENENRYLAEMPEFKAADFLGGDYMTDVDEYVSDQFILRDKWISLQSLSEYGLGKREVNSVFIGNNMLFAKLSPDYEVLRLNTDGINSFKKNYDINCYCILIPSSSEINSEKLPPFAQRTDEKQLISEVYKSLAEVTPISIYDRLKSHSDEYIYYRTDHHWTTYGAYLAYSSICESTGISAGEYSAANVSNAFNGTLFSRSGIRFVDSDRINAFQSSFSAGMTVFTGSQWNNYDNIYFNEYLGKKDKYSYFLGQNQPLITLNGTSGTGKSLLIFRDSFSSCLAPMLLSEYDTITLVDMRYINTDLDELINVRGYDDAMFIYSTDIFSSQLNSAKLI